MTISSYQLRRLPWLRLVLGFPGRVVALGLSFALSIHAPTVYALVSLTAIGWGLSAYLVLSEEFDAANIARCRAERGVCDAVAELRIAQARLSSLTAELADARAVRSYDSNDDDSQFRKVGLHPQCPAFLIAAARRAYRLALHPDRQPEHLKHEAHARFVAAEEIFAEIMSSR